MAKKKVKTKPNIGKKTVSKIQNADAKKSKSSSYTALGDDMLYSRKHYMTILLGIGVMALGYLLMSGGSMPDSNTWDESIIYGWRRTVLAPLLILAGLGIEIYAIFRK